MGSVDVFISYRSADRAWVRGLATYLIANGLSVYNNFSESTDGIESGAEVVTGYSAALRQAACVVFVITPDFFLSDDTSREVANAYNWGKRKILLYARTVFDTANEERLPHFYRSLNFVDCRHLNEDDAFARAFKATKKEILRPLASASAGDLRAAYDAVCAGTVLVEGDLSGHLGLAWHDGGDALACSQRTAAEIQGELSKGGEVRVSRIPPDAGETYVRVVEADESQRLARLRIRQPWRFPRVLAYRMDAELACLGSPLGTVGWGTEKGHPVSFASFTLERWASPVDLDGGSTLYVEGAPIFDPAGYIVGTADQGSTRQEFLPTPMDTR
ncbi:MAG: toll/interleukin-1 receptor domain-containing protein [Pseudomonadota bacterium]